MKIPSGKPIRISRRNALKLFAAGVAGGGACLADAFLIEPGLLSITRKDIPCAKLPGGLDGLRIALMTDFHFRPGEDDSLLEKTIATVNREKPDLIALGGDYMSGNPRVIAPLLAGLRKLQARHGIFAVMGNHDGWAGNPLVIRRQFEKAGISFLINGNSRLHIRGESLAVAGTDFVWKGNPDPELALKGIAAETPVLALVHEPDYFDTITIRRDILLQLSGHTHGGQCRIPLIGYAPAKVTFGRNYVYGGFQRGDSRLFVSRGIGMSGPSIRFACPPELAILTLRTNAGA